jgi:hypothetical protein
MTPMLGICELVFHAKWVLFETVGHFRMGRMGEPIFKAFKSGDLDSMPHLILKAAGNLTDTCNPKIFPDVLLAVHKPLQCCFEIG